MVSFSVSISFSPFIKLRLIWRLSSEILPSYACSVKMIRKKLCSHCIGLCLSVLCLWCLQMHHTTPSTSPFVKTTWGHTVHLRVTPLSCICLSVLLFSCPDEADEAGPASPSQCGTTTTSRALQEAHMANTDTWQPQAHRARYYRLCAEYDAAGSISHVQQDWESGCSPGPTKFSTNEAWASHSPCAWEVSVWLCARVVLFKHY